MGDVKLYRYYLPSLPTGEGWAEIVVGSNGFFAAVSDFGNYAFAWRHHGCADFRAFLLRAGRDWDYFARKLGGEHAEEYDGPRTERLVQEHILTDRRARTMSMSEAREEWELLAENGHLETRDDFAAWMQHTKIGDAWEMGCRRIAPMLERFCREAMVRLGEMIQAELAAESTPAEAANG